MSKRRLAAIYFLVQAIAGAGWWVGVAVSAEWRRWFWPNEVGEPVLRAFAVADIALFVLGSFVAAALIRAESSAASRVAWFVTGGVAYAWLYCLGQWFETGEAFSSAATMAPAMVGSAWAASKVS